MNLDHSKYRIKFYSYNSCFINRPDIQHFLEKLKREKEAKKNAQENDNRPFILKYVTNKTTFKFKKIIILFLVEIFTSNSRYFRPSKCFY